MVSSDETSVWRSTLTSSGPGAKVERGTVSAPILAPASQLTTQSGSLACSTPSRVPLPTPAANSRLASFELRTSDSPKVSWKSGPTTNASRQTLKQTSAPCVQSNRSTYRWSRQSLTASTTPRPRQPSLRRDSRSHHDQIALQPEPGASQPVMTDLRSPRVRALLTCSTGEAYSPPRDRSM